MKGIFVKQTNPTMKDIARMVCRYKESKKLIFIYGPELSSISLARMISKNGNHRGVLLVSG